MPAPRAAQGHRKSVVPDPDLYADSDGSDAEPEDARPPPKRSRTTSATPADSAAAAAAAHKGLVRKGSKGPQPVRGSVTSDAGRRRSTRLSNEGAPDPPPAATHHGKARGTKPTRKRTKERDSDDAHAATAAGDRDAPHHDDDQGEDDKGGRSMHSPRAGSKRPRIDLDPTASSSHAGASAPSASASSASQSAPAPRRGFIVCPLPSLTLSRVKSASFSPADSS